MGSAYILKPHVISFTIALTEPESMRSSEASIATIDLERERDREQELEDSQHSPTNAETSPGEFPSGTEENSPNS